MTRFGPPPTMKAAVGAGFKPPPTPGTFWARPVCQGLSLEIGAGERVAVLGPSEAGNSTLALCLQGLIPRMIKGEFRGGLEVAGATPPSLRPRQLASRVGTLFQDFEAQLFSTRVDPEVAFGTET